VTNTPGTALTLAAIALLLGTGAWADAPLPSCPEGSHAVGHAPPKGLEWRCDNATGVPEGPWLTWYDNGQMMSERHMKNGREHGRQRSWWPNGQLMMEGISVDGNRFKGFKYWGIDGSLQQIGIKPQVIEKKYEQPGSVTQPATQPTSQPTTQPTK